MASTWAKKFYDKLKGTYGFELLEKSLEGRTDVSEELSALKVAIESLAQYIPDVDPPKGTNFGTDDIEQIKEAVGYMHLAVGFVSQVSGINSKTSRSALQVRNMTASLFNKTPEEGDVALIAVARALGKLCDKLIRSVKPQSSKDFYIAMADRAATAV